MQVEACEDLHQICILVDRDLVLPGKGENLLCQNSDTLCQNDRRSIFFRIIAERYGFFSFLGHAVAETGDEGVCILIPLERSGFNGNQPRRAYSSVGSRLHVDRSLRSGAGVMVLAYQAKVSPAGIEIFRGIPVAFHDPVLRIIGQSPCVG